MNVVTTDHRVPSGRDGLALLVRNKCVRPGGTPVLFVHGATYPSTVTFDYPVDGRSWMDALALAGFDTWCVDLLGYGGSDRPPEMQAPAADHGPIVDTAEAVADVRRTMDFIRRTRDVATLDLIGYSWGTAICGQVAGEAVAEVRRLVLAGALWVRAGNVQIAVDGPLGAYRLVDADATVRRWLVNLDAAQCTAIAPRAQLEAWARAAVASDPASARHTPPLLRAPTGVVKDVTTYWLRDVPTYDPGAIRCPVQIVVGEWDQETTPGQGLGVFAALTGTPTRRFTLVGGASHLMLLEAQRQQLYDVVAGFLAAEAP